MSKLAAALAVSVLFAARPIAAQTPDDGPKQMWMGEYVAGGVVGTFVGFGIGHAVQGRWSEDGWIFTVGETAALAAYVAGLAMISSDLAAQASADANPTVGGGGVGLSLVGGLAMMGIHIWEIVDVWSGARPHSHSRKESGSDAAVKMSVVPVPLTNGAALSFALQY